MSRLSTGPSFTLEPDVTVEPAPVLEPDLQQVQNLRDAFETFSKSASQLGQAYAALEARAAQVDQELARAHSLQRTILESIPSGLVARDASGCVTAVNGAACALLGIERGPLAGVRLLQLHSADGTPLLEPLSETSRIRTEERSFVRADGRALALLWTRTPLGSGLEREPKGSLDVFTDVTEVQRLRADCAARERLTALGETAAALAHQVRNPLNGFQGFLGLLMRELSDLPTTAPARVYASKALEGARELEKVVAGILDLARPETLERQRVFVADLLHEVVDAVAQAGRPVERVTVDAPVALEVHADGLRLKQALVNLVENALEATPEPGHVRLRARRRAQAVLLEVEDEGRGIEPALLPRLFQPFATTRVQGSGLGLAYARKVVELHGGTVSARNRKPRGARFTIELRSQEGDR